MEKTLSHDKGVSAAHLRLDGVGVRLWLLAATGIALVVGYHRLLFSHAPMMFADPKEDMSFAWYVPLFSLYVVWKERAKLVDSLREPSWVGAVAAIPFLFLGFLGTRGIQVRLEMVAFAGLLLTLPWAFFGSGHVLKSRRCICLPADPYQSQPISQTQNLCGKYPARYSVQSEPLR